MFTKVVSVVLVAAALASAQSSISLPAGLPSIDSCTQNCLTQAATANSCTLTDVSCVCSNAAFQQAAASCLQSSCPSADLSTALALENAICGGTSASASASSAATSAATSSSAASSASSVASSNSATAGSATSHASSAATSAASSLSSAASSAANSLSSPVSSAASSLSSQLSSATSAGASGSASAGNAVAVNMHGLVGLGVALVGVAAGAGLVL